MEYLSLDIDYWLCCATLGRDCVSSTINLNHRSIMPEFYDDNFGHWHDMDEPENREFYRQVQRESVWKKCQGCGRRVKIRPDYAICNSCAERRERGLEY